MMASRVAAPASQVAPSRVIASRVDWLTLAFKVKLDQSAVGELLEALERARAIGCPDRCSVALAGRIFLLRATRGRGRYLLTNADVVATLELGASGGWTVGVEYSGSRIAQLTLRRAVEVGREIARSLGLVLRERCRRLDLCADVEGFNLDALQDNAWIMPPRARSMSIAAEHIDKVYEPAKRTYRRGGRVTGIVVCPKGDVSLVAYDKREELATHTDDRKRDFEEAIWREAGWQGSSSVGRVELRFRSEALRQLGDRDAARGVHENADRLDACIDSLWQYGCRNWVRLVVRGTASRLKNCTVDPRWQAVQQHVFVHASPAATRARVRGGATPFHVLGTALSYLASASKLAAPLELLRADGECLGDAGLALLDGREARAALEAEVESLVRPLVPGIAVALALRCGGSDQKAAASMRELKRASIARFTSDERRDDDDAGKANTS